MANLLEKYRDLARKRAAQMARLRDRGWSYARIGQKYGLTRQRAFQIVTAYDAEQAAAPEQNAATALAS